jgi:ribonuclease HI
LEILEEEWCNMHFDGTVSKEGVGAIICITGPNSDYRSLSYKLYFDCTNNVVEYEALILGLKMIKELKIKKVSIYGDSELVINKVKGVYQAKHPKMRAYRNVVLNLLQDIP